MYRIPQTIPTHCWATLQAGRQGDTTLEGRAAVTLCPGMATSEQCWVPAFLDSKTAPCRDWLGWALPRFPFPRKAGAW